MQQKEKLERTLNVDNDKSAKIIAHISVSFFPNFTNVIGFIFMIMFLAPKIFLCGFLYPCKIDKILRFGC